MVEDGSRCEEILLKRKACSETRPIALGEDERRTASKKYLFLKQTEEADGELASQSNMKDAGSSGRNTPRSVFCKRYVYQELCITNYTIWLSTILRMSTVTNTRSIKFARCKVRYLEKLPNF